MKSKFERGGGDFGRKTNWSYEAKTEYLDSAWNTYLHDMDIYKYVSYIG